MADDMSNSNNTQTDSAFDGVKVHPPPPLDPMPPVNTTTEALVSVPAPHTPQRQRPTVPAPSTPACLTSSVAVANAWVASGGTSSASSCGSSVSNATATFHTQPQEQAPFSVHSPPRNQTQRRTVNEDDATHLVARTLQSLSVHTGEEASSSMEPNANNNNNNTMMGMRATGSSCPSPAHSHVSTGSAAPTTTRYDLTPITRNTSLTFLDHTGSSGGVNGQSQSGPRGVPITPPHHLDQLDDGLLHGEHLTLPSAQDVEDYHGGNDSTGSDSGVQGFLRRPSSAGTSLLRRSSRSSTSHDTAVSPFTLVAPTSTPPPPPPQLMVAPGLPSHDDHSNTASPIPLQLHRKCHTFTTREQYEAAMMPPMPQAGDDDDALFLQASSDDEEELTSAAARRPYMPSHRFDDEDDEEEELDGPASAFDAIFKPDTATTIPLEQVPSLRLAHPMYGGGSTTSLSYTGGEETDEDSLVHCTSDGRRLSYSHDDSFTGGMQYSMDEDQKHISNSHSRMLLDDDDEDEDTDSNHQGFGGPLLTVIPPPDLIRSRKKRKTPRRERQARAWLQEIQGDAGCVAEAASSVFLRQPTQVVTPQRPSVALRRQASAPPT